MELLMKKFISTVLISFVFLINTVMAGTLYWCPSANAFVTNPAHCIGCSAE